MLLVSIYMPTCQAHLHNHMGGAKMLHFSNSGPCAIAKGAPALESQTDGWLVVPHQDLDLNLGLRIFEHARVCRHVVYILEHVEMIHWPKKNLI